MEKFTHFDLLEITKKEAEFKTLLIDKKEGKIASPKKETIDNILNYSKALSIRKSKSIEFIEMVLN